MSKLPLDELIFVAKTVDAIFRSELSATEKRERRHCGMPTCVEAIKNPEQNKSTIQALTKIRRNAAVCNISVFSYTLCALGYFRRTISKRALPIIPSNLVSKFVFEHVKKLTASGNVTAVSTDIHREHIVSGRDETDGTKREADDYVKSVRTIMRLAKRSQRLYTHPCYPSYVVGIAAGMRSTISPLVLLQIKPIQDLWKRGAFSVPECTYGEAVARYKRFVKSDHYAWHRRKTEVVNNWICMSNITELIGNV